MTRVLVVDDSVSVRKALERVLAPRQLEVVSASSAEQALEKVTLQRPDLVITDVVMPGMSGFEFCQMLKNTEPFTEIPVILISGIVDDHVLAQSRAVGAASVVTKPFTPEDLFPKIDSALASIKVKQPEPVIVKAEPVKAEPVAANYVSSAASMTGSIPSSAIPSSVIPSSVIPSSAVPSAASMTDNISTDDLFAPEPIKPSAPAPSPIPVPAMAPVIPASGTGGYTAAGIRAHLEPFLEKTEIETALLVMNRTGETISSVGQALQDPNLFATYCRTLVSISTVFGEQLGHGGLQGVTLEYLNKNILLFSVNERFSLALVMQGGSSAGIARYLVQRQTPLIRSLLESN
jgi:CheY-like chemotaxis protein/predicted regulator of Ras-like GTPase activity (Roadblock/LC7/MglB family)